MYMKLYRRYITRLKILTTHMKATNTISYIQTYRFDHKQLIINSQLSQLKQIMFLIFYQQEKVKIQLNQNQKLVMKLRILEKQNSSLEYISAKIRKQKV